MSAELTNKEIEAAKSKLHAAITEFYRIVHPEAFISAWVLLTHKETVALAAENNSMVGLVTPTGQAFPLTRGMLHVAIDGQTIRGSD